VVTLEERKRGKTWGRRIKYSNRRKD